MSGVTSVNGQTGVATIDLQSAYDQGSSITTNSGSGSVSISGTETTQFAATGSTVATFAPTSGQDGLALLASAGGGSIGMRASAGIFSYSISWPGMQGAANTFLSNDGFGNLNWITPTPSPQSLQAAYNGHHSIAVVDSPGSIEISTDNAQTVAPMTIDNQGTGTAAILITTAGSKAIASPDTTGTDQVGDLAIGTGSNSGTGGPGVLTLSTGDMAAGNTGTIVLQTGTVDDAAGSSGYIEMGTGANPSGSTGPISIRTADGAVQSGDINIQTGASAGSSGSINLTTNGGGGGGANIAMTVASAGVITMNGGRVGVGTSTPFALFDVENTNASLLVDTTNIQMYSSTTGGTLFIQNLNASGPVLDLTGSTAGTLHIKVPNTVSTYSLTLPSAQGAASTVLTNNGSGVLSWVAAAAAPSIGGTLTSATAGSVLFAGPATFAQDNANFFWDITNHRLGIGTTTPAHKLEVAGNALVGGLTLDTTVITNPVAGGDVTVTTDGTGTLNLGGGTGVSVTGDTDFVDNVSIEKQLALNTPNTGVSGSVSGTAFFNQCLNGSAHMKVVIYAQALNGTASFTFPTPFSFTPQIMTTDGPAAGVVTSLSTTAVTITGAPTTGFIFLEGF